MSANPRPFHVCEALDLLLSRAAPLLTAADLQGLRRATEDAAEQARWAADLANNVGSLIASDEDTGTYASSAEVAGLLFHLAATFNNVSALAGLGRGVERLVHAQASAAVNVDPAVLEFWKRSERTAKRRTKRTKGKG